MLVLTRRKQESFYIGECGDIKVTVLEIKGNQIKIGIDAPKTIPVNRSEIFEKILQQKGKSMVIDVPT